MTRKKTLRERERERELQALVATPSGRQELQDLVDRYAAAGGRPRLGGASLVTCILVHERTQGLIGG